MTINYNVTGTERKRLADYISGFMGTEKKYLGAPTFAYQIGYLTVSKDGAVSFEDRGYKPVAPHNREHEPEVTQDGPV